MILRFRRLTRLVDADPHFYQEDGIRFAGMHFECPIHEDCRLGVKFKNPIGGERREHGWERVGEDFAAITITPSIRSVPHHDDDCAWHGFITNGEFVTLDDSK